MSFTPVGPKAQWELLLDHFRRFSTITPIEAAAMFRIRSLSRRIVDLKERGHLFYSEQRLDSTGQRYVRYHYLGSEAGVHIPQGKKVKHYSDRKAA